MDWTGPREGDVDSSCTLLRDLPPERWPYGPPAAHEDWCLLKRCTSYALTERDARKGTFCDCDASDSSA